MGNAATRGHKVRGGGLKKIGRGPTWKKLNGQEKKYDLNKRGRKRIGLYDTAKFGGVKEGKDWPLF